MQEIFLSILLLRHNMANLKMMWPSHTEKAVRALHWYINASTSYVMPFTYMSEGKKKYCGNNLKPPRTERKRLSGGKAPRKLLQATPFRLLENVGNNNLFKLQQIYHVKIYKCKSLQQHEKAAKLF